MNSCESYGKVLVLLDYLIPERGENDTLLSLGNSAILCVSLTWKNAYLIKLLVR